MYVVMHDALLSLYPGVYERNQMRMMLQMMMMMMMMMMFWV